MATINYTATPIVGGYLVNWSGFASGDTCVAFPDGNQFALQQAAILTDRNVQTAGTTHGTIHIEGSNAIATAAAVYATLHEVDGTTALSITSANIKQVLEATYYIRPAPTNGNAGGSCLLKVTTQAEKRI
jgi:hypothetical protein